MARGPSFGSCGLRRKLDFQALALAGADKGVVEARDFGADCLRKTGAQVIQAFLDDAKRTMPASHDPRSRRRHAGCRSAA